MYLVNLSFCDICKFVFSKLFLKYVVLPLVRVEQNVHNLLCSKILYCKKPAWRRETILSPKRGVLKFH